VGLGDAAGRRIGTMSKGMQQRLGLAQALVGDPRLLLLDEPTSALDPAGRRLVRALLERLRERGVAVLLNSHLLSEVELVCDRVAIIAGGAVVAAGRPDELSRPGGVEVETGSGTRTYSVARREDVPGIVAGLVEAGEPVYEVRVLRSTLEDAYLEAVAGAPTGDGPHPTSRWVPYERGPGHRRVLPAREPAATGLHRRRRDHGHLPGPLRAGHLAGVPGGR
jgi:ABC-2 type transport system ATP-binding protein